MFSRLHFCSRLPVVEIRAFPLVSRPSLDSVLGSFSKAAGRRAGANKIGRIKHLLPEPLPATQRFFDLFPFRTAANGSDTALCKEA